MPAYAVLADLLDDVEAAAWAELSDVERLAVDRVLLRADTEGPATDQRAVAASFLTIVEHLADDSPVLLAIDDLQWLDTSSQKVIAYAARRFTGRVGCSVPFARVQAPEISRGFKCRGPTPPPESRCRR